MLSRVAERLYWMARYIERTENTARLLNAYNLLMLDLPKGVGLSWSQLVDLSGGHDDFAARYRSANERNTQAFMLSDKENSSSIIAS
ncbi:MAG: alpha-E domain-containing protein, partial [Thiogranum sp.]